MYSALNAWKLLSKNSCRIILSIRDRNQFWQQSKIFFDEKRLLFRCIRQKLLNQKYVPVRNTLFQFSACDFRYIEYCISCIWNLISILSKIYTDVSGVRHKLREDRSWINGSIKYDTFCAITDKIYRIVCDVRRLIAAAQLVGTHYPLRTRLVRRGLNCSDRIALLIGSIVTQALAFRWLLGIRCPTPRVYTNQGTLSSSIIHLSSRINYSVPDSQLAYFCHVKISHPKNSTLGMLKDWKG